MEADLLSGVGTSNGCTVGCSVHGVVVVGDLFRGHRLMGGEKKVSDWEGRQVEGLIYHQHGRILERDCL
jgi:hypothetical protein